MSRPTLDDWIGIKIGSDFSDREDLEHWQLDRLNRTLSHAVKNSSFYRSLYAGFCVSALSDLEKLPFTTPRDLKEDPYRMVCVHPNEISRIVTLKTSGSTGDAKRVFFTEEDLELCTDYFRYGMRNLVDETDIVGILFPYRTPGSVGDQLIRGLWRMGAETVALYGLPDDEIASLISFKKITSLAGMPEQIGRFAKRYPQLSTLKSVLLSADYVSDEVRRTIRMNWNAQVFEHYGMTEMGLGCAVSCECRNGYHVREADMLLEIIDPETGAVVPDGTWGEIVFTSLTRVGMPFIRYRTGDISRWKTEMCACGSKLKLLDYIQDRTIKKGQVNL